MKNQIHHHLPYLAFVAIAFLACKQPAAISFESQSVCHVDADGARQCYPLGGGNMVILQRHQDTLQFLPAQAPDPNDPRFGPQWPSLVELHDALVADSAVFDFDPAATTVSWDDRAFVIADKSTGQTIFSQTSSADLTPVFFQAQAGLVMSVSFLENTVCKSIIDVTAKLNARPEKEGVILCGLSTENCEEFRALQNDGPVIVVTVDNIIGDTPRQSRLGAWAAVLEKELKRVKIRPKKTTNDWKTIDNPINGGHFPQSITGSILPQPLLSDIASPFRDLCLITNPNPSIDVCDGFARIFADGVLLASIPVKGRQIKILKEADTGGFRIAVTPGPEPIYLDPDSPLVVRL